VPGREREHAAEGSQDLLPERLQRREQQGRVPPLRGRSMSCGEQALPQAVQVVELAVVGEDPRGAESGLGAVLPEPHDGEAPVPQGQGPLEVQAPGVRAPLPGAIAHALEGRGLEGGEDREVRQGSNEAAHAPSPSGRSAADWRP